MIAMVLSVMAVMALVVASMSSTLRHPDMLRVMSVQSRSEVEFGAPGGD